MKYDFDSYLLYEVTSSSLYTAKAVVELNIPVRGEVLREAAQKAFRRFPYYSRTIRRDEQGAFVLEPCEEPICVFEEEEQVTLGTKQTNGLLFAIARILCPGNDVLVIGNKEIQSVINKSKKSTVFHIPIRIRSDYPVDVIRELLERELQKLFAKNGIRI